MSAIIEELERKKSRHHTGRLSATLQKQFELAACGMLKVGRIDDAMKIFEEIHIDPPSDLLLVCRDRLLEAGNYQKAFAVSVDAHDAAAMQAFGERCQNDRQYEWAFKAFEHICAIEALQSLGVLCQRRDRGVAVQCFKTTGNIQGLLELGIQCMSGNAKQVGLSIALDAFSACSDRDQLKQLGEKAEGIWESDPKKHEEIGVVAKNAFLRADAKCKVVELGEKAMPIDPGLSFQCFQEAGAKHKLIALGDQYLQADDSRHAIQCFKEAGAYDRLFDCAVALVRDTNPHNAFCNVYSNNRLIPPFERFEELAARYLEQGDEKKAWEIYHEIAFRRS